MNRYLAWSILGMQWSPQGDFALSSGTLANCDLVRFPVVPGFELQPHEVHFTRPRIPEAREVQCDFLVPTGRRFSTPNATNRFSSRAARPAVDRGEEAGNSPL